MDHAFKFINKVIFLVWLNNIRSQKAVLKIAGIKQPGTRKNGLGVESVIFEINRKKYNSNILV